MCSMKSPELLGSDGLDAMVNAVAAVSERSFFAVVEPCDEARFAGLPRPDTRWMAATVRFREPDCRGRVSCTLSEELAHALFNAFTGRDPLDPAAEPHPALLADLIGEFANMICGTWLSKQASRQLFTLSRPEV